MEHLGHVSDLHTLGIATTVEHIGLHHIHGAAYDQVPVIPLALPPRPCRQRDGGTPAELRHEPDIHPAGGTGDRKSTRLNSSHGYTSYAVFCLKKKKQKIAKADVEPETGHPDATLYTEKIRLLH